jgi:uncharacterized protein (DUF1697 family)
VTTFVVMLRSVNVSGRNRLPMEDLRGLVVKAGLAEVQTYVQSGNVVCAGRGPSAAVARAIEEQMDADLGWSVPAIVRSRTELRNALEAMPFPVDDHEPKTLHVTFMSRAPAPGAVESLDAEAGRFGEDRAVVVGRDVFLLCPGGYGVTKLNNGFLERRLGTVATTRSWRTVTTLAGMADIET